MTVTKELTIALFSLFPFLEMTCVKVADETQSEAEIVQEILDNPYTPNDVEVPVWTAELPGNFTEGTEEAPEDPEEADNEEQRLERFQRAKEIEEANGGNPWISGPRIQRSPHEMLGLPNIPDYATSPYGLPIIFGPWGMPFFIPLSPGTAYHTIPVSPTQYESMYWENMYSPYTDSRGVQLLELNNYGYPVRIPGTTVELPTPDQFAMLYYHWQYNGESDARWNHPTSHPTE
tara:strand:+ start:17952 stop:18650 length:699 start_codon:yes stop_codon:yes gene_type:complete